MVLKLARDTSRRANVSRQPPTLHYTCPISIIYLVWVTDEQAPQIEIFFVMPCQRIQLTWDAAGLGADS